MDWHLSLFYRSVRLWREGIAVKGGSMQQNQKMSEVEVIIAALEADYCVDQGSAMTSERLIELCDYSYLFDEEAIEQALMSLIKDEVISADVDSNDEPIFWLTHPVLH